MSSNFDIAETNQHIFLSQSNSQLLDTGTNSGHNRVMNSRQRTLSDCEEIEDELGYMIQSKDRVKCNAKDAMSSIWDGVDERSGKLVSIQTNFVAFTGKFAVNDNGRFIMKKREGKEKREQIPDMVYEYEVLKYCEKSPFVVKALGLESLRHRNYLIMERSVYSNLDNFMRDRNHGQRIPVHERELRLILHDMLQALNFLEEEFIVHRMIGVGTVFVWDIHPNTSHIRGVKLGGFERAIHVNHDIAHMAKYDDELLWSALSNKDMNVSKSFHGDQIMTGLMVVSIIQGSVESIVEHKIGDHVANKDDQISKLVVPQDVFISNCWESFQHTWILEVVKRLIGVWTGWDRERSKALLRLTG